MSAQPPTRISSQASSPAPRHTSCHVRLRLCSTHASSGQLGRTPTAISGVARHSGTGARFRPAGCHGTAPRTSRLSLSGRCTRSAVVGRRCTGRSPLSCSSWWMAPNSLARSWVTRAALWAALLSSLRAQEPSHHRGRDIQVSGSCKFMMALSVACARMQGCASK